MNAPKLSFPSSIVIAAFLIAAAVWQLSEKNRYTLSLVTGYPIVCDGKTGKVWSIIIKDGSKLIFDPAQK